MGPITLLLPSRTTTADANVTSKFLTLSDYLSCTLVCWVNVTVLVVVISCGGAEGKCFYFKNCFS